MQKLIFIVCLLSGSRGGFSQSVEKNIAFSGYDWSVRSTTEKQGPGPNYFSESVVQTDSNGWLHLFIRKDSVTGQWHCPELTSLKIFGFGTYQFVVDGAIDRLDKNIVLGLFNYSGRDGLDEMDIEFARWGKAAYPNLNFTIWPAKDSLKNSSTTHEFKLAGNLSTHRFRRTGDSVICSSFNGSSPKPADLIFSSVFASPGNSVSKLPMPVHINFWLFDGKPPENLQPVEVIIRSFSFKADR